MSTVSEFTVLPGERVPFVLTWFPSHEPLPDEIDAEQALADTEEYWLSWAEGCTHVGDYHDEIHQSLLVLKALTYAPTGGIVAAPTTSLPERIGGVRNWDYRFCWLRDATLTLLAMLRSGYRDEAIMLARLALARRCRRPGRRADHVRPRRRATPRRICARLATWLRGLASGASRERRLVAAPARRLRGGARCPLPGAANGAPPSDPAWSLVQNLLEWLADGWRLEDAGIWEVRGPNRHFTHSKVMAWVAFDRAIRFHEVFEREGPVDRWRTLRDEIHAEVLRCGWSEEKQAFTQSYDSPDLDASVLLLPLVGFLPATDPRMISTVEAIRRELTVEGLVLRYRPQDAGIDGLPGDEGVFLPCSFWLAGVLGLQGKHAEARELFERLLDLRNDLGLLSEEYDPHNHRQLGNFPQAFTHLSLVNTAFVLAEGRGIRDT